MRDANKENIVIVGAGGHGSELCSYIQDLITQGEKLSLIGCVDEYKPREAWCGTEILGNFAELKAWLAEQEDTVLHYITAVGNNRLRAEFVSKLERLEVRSLLAWTLKHPTAIVGQSVELGAGSCLAPGSIVTTNVRVGKHCIINVKASISHDCQVGDFCNINPGAVIAGNVHIGEGGYIGAGATVIEKVSIGDWAIVGAGAVVIDDVPPHTTVVGVPAKVLKRNA
jgi:acetyltransferase EpsM